MQRINPNDLPHPNTDKGEPRRVGVEIELGGLDEAKVADVVSNTLGGQINKTSGRRVVATPQLGEIEVYLDTRFRDRLENGPDNAKALAASVVPVEIVTPPILPKDIALLDDLVRDLRTAGASGTEDGPLLGFGVHFNPEVRAMQLDHILPVLTMFGLLEDHIRATDPIDLSRAVLPFVDPYPTSLVDALASTPPKTLDALIDTYLDHAPSRDHALDMTCILTLHDKDRMASKMDLTEVSARPTFHYRLPDFRPGDPDWSLTATWNRWVWVERLSDDADLLTKLRKAWVDHREDWFDTRSGWAKRTSQILENHTEKRAT